MPTRPPAAKSRLTGFAKPGARDSAAGPCSADGMRNDEVGVHLHISPLRQLLIS